MWKLSTKLLNNWEKEEITREIRKYLELSKDENTTYQAYGVRSDSCKHGIEKKVDLKPTR